MKRTVICIAAAALLLAGCNLDDGSSGTKAKGAGAGTATVAESPTSGVTEEADAEPEKPETYKPTKSDFKILTKLTSKDCFGSAGCNVEYKVGLKWVGPVPAPRLDKSYDLYYRVNGLDGGGSTGTITVTPKLRYSPDENFGSTGSSSDVLSATILRISPANGF